ncbi:MAG: accessory factor UbiK family protein [Gammaproteobacteria bacterium]
MKDLKQNIRHLVRGALAHTWTQLNLVTREEFDIQTNVLARTRQKLEALEKRVALLEAQRKEPDVTGNHS